MIFNSLQKKTWPPVAYEEATEKVPSILFKL